MNLKRDLLLLMAAVAVGSIGTAASANHKFGHQNPPGFEDKARDHRNTVNSDAGGGNGGEPCCGLGPTDSEVHTLGGDTDPGNSESVNQAGKAE
jgi:hypothetical protein